MSRERIFKREPGERNADYFARFAGKLAEAAMLAQERDDQVRALFFAVKAAETLQLAKAFGFDGQPLPQPPLSQDSEDER